MKIDKLYPLDPLTRYICEFEGRVLQELRFQNRVDVEELWLEIRHCQTYSDGRCSLQSWLNDTIRGKTMSLWLSAFKRDHHNPVIHNWVCIFHKLHLMPFMYFIYRLQNSCEWKFTFFFFKIKWQCICCIFNF